MTQVPWSDLADGGGGGFPEALGHDVIMLLTLHGDAVVFARNAIVL